jgi:hypothetical protein
MFTCPKCERQLRSLKQWHFCAKVQLGDLFKDKAEELEYIFDQLLAEIVDWEDVIISTTKNCVVFVHRKTFLVVKPMKKQLEIKFYSATENNDVAINKSILWNSKYENHVRLLNVDALTPKIFSFIKQSYQIC